MSDKTEEKQTDKPWLFKKGESGNPNGRPKDSFSLITILKAELQKCPEGQDRKTYADLLIQRILKKAISDGDDAQIKNILQYIEGMPKQNLDLTSKDERIPLLGGISVLYNNSSDKKDTSAKEED